MTLADNITALVRYHKRITVGKIIF